MKFYCRKDRKKYKREQLDLICPRCKFKACNHWFDYNGGEDEMPDKIAKDVLNLKQTQIKQINEEYTRITGEKL